MNLGLEAKKEIMHLTHMVLDSWTQALKKGRETGNLGFRSEPKKKAEETKYQRICYFEKIF